MEIGRKIEREVTMPTLFHNPTNEHVTNDMAKELRWLLSANAKPPRGYDSLEALYFTSSYILSTDASTVHIIEHNPFRLNGAFHIVRDGDDFRVIGEEPAFPTDLYPVLAQRPSLFHLYVRKSYVRNALSGMNDFVSIGLTDAKSPMLTLGCGKRVNVHGYYNTYVERRALMMHETSYSRPAIDMQDMQAVFEIVNKAVAENTIAKTKQTLLKAIELLDQAESVK